ncbi:site-specific integrase, partial [Candidatus Burkholderia verschuerenii]|uniref:site-specific integrase n=1 Tax=Candidatus Burkholderia verschuerenii TaxID=242163 RepID=UPI0012EE2B7E
FSAQHHASTSTRALQTWLRCAFTSAPDCVVGSIPANSILQARRRQIKRDTRLHWRLLVRLALATGARLQELVLAEWSEFPSYVVWVIPEDHCKSGEWRPVPLGRSARRVIKLLKNLRDPNDPRLFHTIKNPAAASGCFHRYVREAGIVNFRFHDLRHEAISRWYMFERGLKERHISCMVGHSSRSQTRDYVLLRADELAELLN